MNTGRGGMLGLLLLRVVSEYSGLRRKPPVTAALIAANTLIYLRPEFLQPFVPRIDRILFNPHLILKHKDLKRFLLPAFYHLGEPHLVYNMLSLLWKGLQLESALGSFEFAKMVSTLVIMSQGMNLLLAKILLSFGYYKAYYHEFSAGFSGVLFAMKVVLYSQSDDYTYVQGISLPTRYAAWAELILIQLLEPRVSFLGHLGGILAGLLYMQMNATFTGSSPGPLTWIAKGLISFLGWPLRVVNRVFTSSRGEDSEGVVSVAGWRKYGVVGRAHMIIQLDRMFARCVERAVVVVLPAMVFQPVRKWSQMRNCDASELGDLVDDSRLQSNALYDTT